MQRAGVRDWLKLAGIVLLAVAVAVGIGFAFSHVI
jgi:hypothetical protein